MRGKLRLAIPVAVLLSQLVPVQPALAKAPPATASCQLSNGIQHVI